MRLDDVHPDLRDMARRAPRVDVGNAAMRVLARFGARHLVPAARAPGVTTRDLRAGSLRLRVHSPGTHTGGALLWIHGGGMVIGAPRQDDRLCARMAAQLGITVVAPQYRLAPEHPFPAPQEDCLAAWTWLQAHAAELGVDPARVAVGGASAGGGLAASVVNAVHDAARGRSRGTEPVAQLLIYPMLDDRTATRTDLDALDHPVWNNAANRVGWTALLLGTSRPGDDTVPAAAAPARREDLRGLPPTWIGVGDIDLFHDEDVAYARRLKAAGVPVVLDVVPGAPHGFDTLGVDAEVAARFTERALAWLRDAVAPR
jgi:acetyl esterase/lipase